MKKNKNDFPYYFYSTDKWIYLIYPGISGSFNSKSSENAYIYTSPYLVSQDSLHLNQKKYVFVQCKKDFYADDGYINWDEDGIINYLMVFYQ